MAKFKPGQLVITNKVANDWYGITRQGAVCKILGVDDRYPKYFKIELITVLPNNDWDTHSLKSFINGSIRSKIFNLHESTLDSFSFTLLTTRRTNEPQI